MVIETYIIAFKRAVITTPIQLNTTITVKTCIVVYHMIINTAIAQPYPYFIVKADTIHRNCIVIRGFTKNYSTATEKAYRIVCDCIIAGFNTDSEI